MQEDREMLSLNWVILPWMELAPYFGFSFLFLGSEEVRSTNMLAGK